MGLPSKAVSVSKNYSIYKSLFLSIAQNLLSKLNPSSNVFTESKIAS